VEFAGAADPQRRVCEGRPLGVEFIEAGAALDLGPVERRPAVGVEQTEGSR